MLPGNLLFVCAGMFALAVWGQSTLLGQSANDAPGVTVDLSGALVLHRTAVAYPAAVRASGIQGTVIADVTLDAKGNRI